MSSSSAQDSQPWPYQSHSVGAHVKGSKGSGRGLSQDPQLPPGLGASDVTYRYEVNPALALSLLADIQTKVVELQTRLRKVVGQIQTIYAEGPVVDGWLESSKKPGLATSSDSVKGADGAQSQLTADRALFRHADVDALMAYVQSLESPPPPSKTPPAPEDDLPAYRLCRLDESGQVMSRPCPPDQVAAVSMAIARYQKLSQLIECRQTIETQLKQIVDALRLIKQHHE